MINKIWGAFIIIGITTCLLTGKIELINNEILSSGEQALDMIIKLFPVIALWLGIMKIASASGLLDKLSRLLTPLLSFLFPEIPKGHESLNYISSNIITNMFGLGSVATPFGLKAMKSLQALNKTDTASRSMITFLVINSSGVTIIPTTIISMRMLHKSIDPTCIVIPCILATVLASIAGIIMDSFLARRCKYK